jgi:hypothetical protein
VGTIFEGSKTPFSTWLAAVELVHVFNASAKDIQRQTGVTYKTAWRMKKLLQELAAPRYGSTPTLKAWCNGLQAKRHCLERTGRHDVVTKASDRGHPGLSIPRKVIEFANHSQGLANVDFRQGIVVYFSR